MSAMENQKVTVATPSQDYKHMLPDWELMDTVLSGTRAMREAGERYLPRHERERHSDYNRRLQRSVLFNVTEQTLDSLVGRVFRKALKLGDDIPERIQSEIIPDVDLMGNNLDVFARAWFREGLSQAFAHVLVEMPQLVEGGTAADDMERRPYWVLIPAQNLIFARATILNGKETLQEARILETTTVPDGWGEKEVHRIRVLRPGQQLLYELKGKDDWEHIDTIETGVDHIPLVTFYAHRDGFMRGTPPLLNLAHLNVLHWQSSSDQRHIMTVSRFPILAVAGAAKDEADIQIGPNRLLFTEDPHGRYYYVEHTGAAIGAGRTDLLDLEDQMAVYGSELLRAKPGNETATGRVLDIVESTSDLANMAGVFEDAVAQALDWTAYFMGIPDSVGGRVQVNRDVGLSLAQSAELSELREARKTRDISRKTYLGALKMRGILPEDYDADADMEEIQEELSAFMGQTRLDLDPGAAE